jgi:hypothetical protein
MRRLCATDDTRLRELSCEMIESLTLEEVGNFTFPTRLFLSFPLPLPYCKLDTASGHGYLIAGRWCGRESSLGERDSVARVRRDGSEPQYRVWDVACPISTG